MDPFVFRDSGAQTFASVSAATLAAREVLLQLRTLRTRGARTDRGTHAVLAVTLTGAIVLALRLPRWAPGLSLSGGAVWPFVLGAGVVWAGAAPRWGSVATPRRLLQLTVVAPEGQ